MNVSNSTSQPNLGNMQNNNSMKLTSQNYKQNLDSSEKIINKEYFMMDNFMGDKANANDLGAMVPLHTRASGDIMTGRSSHQPRPGHHTTRSFSSPFQDETSATIERRGGRGRGGGTQYISNTGPTVAAKVKIANQMRGTGAHLVQKLQ